MYNKVWFRCLYQAIINGTADDFAFKTTYVKINVEHPLIRNPEKYQNYSTTAIEKYFTDIKPFHTKLHTLSQRPTTIDETELQIEDSYKNEITIKYERYEREWQGDTVLLGGTFAEVEEIDPYTESDYVESDYSEARANDYSFTTSDSAVEVVYDGNTFIQPAYEGIGEELVGLDLLENVRIRVQTNPVFGIETGDTRSFQIDMFTNYDIQESIAIVDANKTTVSANVDQTTTTIPLADTSVLSSDTGVVWIGTERIVYRARSADSLLFCTRGTLGTSALSHEIGDTVIDASIGVQIPTLAKFADAANNLELAYNDLGTSLSAAGTGRTHTFIRNAGAGTI